MVPYLGLIVGLCYCQIWHSAAVVVRSVLVSRHPRYWTRLSITGMTGESCWLSREQITLSTWLLSFSLTEVTFWWALMRDANVFTSFVHLENSTRIPFLPHDLFISFPIRLFPSPWISSQPTGYSSRISEQSHICPFHLPNQLLLCVLPEVLPSMKISLQQYPSGLFKEGVVVL